jgi:hypothetical protein
VAARTHGTAGHTEQHIHADAPQFPGPNTMQWGHRSGGGGGGRRRRRRRTFRGVYELYVPGRTRRMGLGCHKMRSHQEGVRCLSLRARAAVPCADYGCGWRSWDGEKM